MMSNHVCARPIHPGELLKEEIEYRGIHRTTGIHDAPNQRRPQFSRTFGTDTRGCRRPINTIH